MHFYVYMYILRLKMFVLEAYYPFIQGSLFKRISRSYSLSTYVHRITDDFKFGILMRLDKILFNFSSAIIFINVYVPPENSPAYDGERGSLSIVLESYIAELSTLNLEMIISGYLNARTANLIDLIVCKDDVKVLQEIHELIDGNIGIERISEENIPINLVMNS